MESQLFLGPLVGILQGLLLIIFREQISIFLEKVYKNFPTNKISSQFYKMSYQVRPVYIGILGAVLIGFSCLSFVL